MSQTAILGAGVMGETLLSGLVRAGRRVDNLLVVRSLVAHADLERAAKPLFRLGEAAHFR